MEWHFVIDTIIGGDTIKKSVFYSEEMHFQTAYKIQYPTWTLKKILRLLRNFIRGDYKQ